MNETCYYCDRETHIYCNDCGKPICNDHIYTVYIDSALDAEDGYGDFDEVYICIADCEGID